MAEIKGWEKMQIKTFTKWTNMHLGTRGHKIDDLLTGFNDGTELACLLEILTEEKLKIRAKEKIKMDIHRSENIEICLRHIESKGVKLLNIGSSNILKGDRTLTCGMIWQVILNLDVVETEDQKNAKEALLLWCKAKTKGYDGVNVQNFHNSWTSGLAFCALIHKHKPGMLDYGSLDHGNVAQNMQAAFDAAEKLGIPQLLDVEDMTTGEKPDEKSVMTYLFQWYRYFAKGAKAENAARRIAKLVALTKQLDALKEEFNMKAGDWCAWAKAKTEELAANRPENSLESVQACLGPFQQFQSKEKPPRSKEKVELEALLANLQLKLKNSKRAPFVPAEGQTAEDIAALWDGVLAAEKECSDILKAELARQKKLVDLVARFNRLAKKCESFGQAKKQYLSQPLNIDSVSAAKAKLKLHEGFTNDLGSMSKLSDECGTLADQIEQLNYAEKDAVSERAGGLGGTFAALGEQGAERQGELEAELKKQEEKEKQVLETVDFANAANALLQWASNVEDDVGQSLDTLESAEAVNAQRALYDKAVAARGEQEANLQALVGKAEAMQAGGNADFAGIDVEDVKGQVAAALASLDARAADLDAADAKQGGDADLRNTFLAAATALDEYIKSTTAKAAEEGKDDLDDQLVAVQALVRDRADAGNEKFEAMGAANEAMQGAGINADAVTDLSFETLSADFDALGSTLKSKASAIQDSIAQKKGSEVPPELVAEFKQTFDHFDKNSNGLLSPLELKGVLQAVGDEKTDEEVAALVAELDVDKCGSVKFNEFMQFMMKITQDQGSEDEIVEAFKIITNNGPFITEAQMASVMGADEVAYLTANMPQVEGGYDYKSWTGKAFGN